MVFSAYISNILVSHCFGGTWFPTQNFRRTFAVIYGFCMIYCVDDWLIDWLVVHSSDKIQISHHMKSSYEIDPLKGSHLVHKVTRKVIQD